MIKSIIKTSMQALNALKVKKTLIKNKEQRKP
jgi:hypothetical protein